MMTLLSCSLISHLSIQLLLFSVSLSLVFPHVESLAIISETSCSRSLFIFLGTYAELKLLPPGHVCSLLVWLLACILYTRNLSGHAAKREMGYLSQIPVGVLKNALPL